MGTILVCVCVENEALKRVVLGLKIEKVNFLSYEAIYLRSLFDPCGRFIAIYIVF